MPRRRGRLRPWEPPSGSFEAVRRKREGKGRAFATKIKRQQIIDYNRGLNSIIREIGRQTLGRPRGSYGPPVSGATFARLARLDRVKNRPRDVDAASPGPGHYPGARDSLLAPHGSGSPSTLLMVREPDVKVVKGGAGGRAPVPKGNQVCGYADPYSAARFAAPKYSFGCRRGVGGAFGGVPRAGKFVEDGGGALVDNDVLFRKAPRCCFATAGRGHDNAAAAARAVPAPNYYAPKAFYGRPNPHTIRMGRAARRSVFGSTSTGDLLGPAARVLPGAIAGHGKRQFESYRRSAPSAQFAPPAPATQIELDELLRQQRHEMRAKFGFGA